MTVSDAWSVALVAIVTFVDRRWPRGRALHNFVICLPIFTPLAVLEELAAVRLGIRSYAEEVLQAVSGRTLGGGVLVQRAFLEWSIPARFVVGIAAVTAIILPVEAWLIRTGHRVYGPSAAGAFTGYKLALLDVPVEVAVATPMYAALIIAFIRYWEIAMDNEL